jgi:hypothetical protein
VSDMSAPRPTPTAYRGVYCTAFPRLERGVRCSRLKTVNVFRNLPRLNFTDNTQKSYLETLLRDLLRYPTQIPYSDTLLRNQRSRETRDLIFFHSVTRKRNLKKQTSKKKVIKIFEENYRKENLNTGPNIRETQNK